MFVQPLLLWISHKHYVFWMCVCSLSYPACNANAPYYIAICGLSGFTIFSHGKRYNFREEVLNEKACFDFLYKFCLKYFSFSEELSEVLSYMYIRLPVKYLLLSCFNGTWIFSTNFRKILRYQISWKSVQWERCCSMRTNCQTETDRHDEVNSRFPQFCK